jgi:hypothetical protein
MSRLGHSDENFTLFFSSLFEKVQNLHIIGKVV